MPDHDPTTDPAGNPNSDPVADPAVGPATGPVAGRALSDGRPVAVVGGGEVARVGEVVGDAERLAAAFLLSHHGRTREAYARDLAQFTGWCAYHGLDPLAVRRVHVDGYVEQLTADGVAPSSVVRKLAALSGFYAYGVDEEVVARNPVTRVRRPKVGENVQSTGLSQQEAGLLLAAAERHSPRAAVVVGLLLFCGLRVSELCGAQATDLGHERGHRILTVTRKGGRRQKMVVPPRVVATVENYLDGRTGGALVVTATGRPLDRHAIWRLLRALAAGALPHLAGSIHPHDLRHACATLSLDAGASLRDVQDLLGHQDSRTTRRYDRARYSLDRSPSHRLALLLADDT